MKTFKDFLTEAFDKPYRWVWDTESSDFMVAVAQIKSGDRLKIIFDDYGKHWDIRFMVGSKNFTGTEFGDTGSFDAFRIMATVLSCVKEFLKKVPEASMIKFDAAKPDSKGNEVKVKLDRANVYDRMLKRYLPSNWSYTKKDTGNDTEFTLKKK